MPLVTLNLILKSHLVVRQEHLALCVSLYENESVARFYSLIQLGFSNEFDLYKKRMQEDVQLGLGI